MRSADFVCALGMSNHLAVRVRYRLGGRNYDISEAYKSLHYL